MNQLGRLPKIHPSPSRDPSMNLVADQMVNGNFWDLGSYLNRFFNGAINCSVFWTLSIYVKLLLVSGTVNYIFV